MMERRESSKMQIDISEVSVYFEDILRNKDMIKEMFKTNILVYEDKIKANSEKLNILKDELKKVNSDFQLIENKLKLDYAKSHDIFQKHDINLKLLEKTSSHYKYLIREREEEIKKLEEQSIYAYQDYQNKKVKLDCIAVQIVEAEFQLQNLQKEVDNKINQRIEESRENKECNENSNSLIDEEIHLKTQRSIITNKTENKINKVSKPTDSSIFDTITMDNSTLSKHKCFIF